MQRPAPFADAEERASSWSRLLDLRPPIDAGACPRRNSADPTAWMPPRQCHRRAIR